MLIPSSQYYTADRIEVPYILQATPWNSSNDRKKTIEQRTIW